MPEASTLFGAGSADLSGVADASLDPYSQQLLNLAQQQGGAVAQTAAETVHPNGSFLSMAQDKLGNAFHDVMNTLAMPSETVAALMSGTDIGTAYSQHLTPSKVLFGSEVPETGLGKAGMFGVKLLTDALLDPLTYVTFGEYGGLMGLSKLPSIPLKEGTAKMLGYGVTAIKDGDKVAYESVTHHALSQEGLAAKGQETARIEDNIRKDTLEQYNGGGVGSFNADGTPGAFMSSDNIRGRINRTLGNLMGKSPEEINKFLTNPYTQGAEMLAAQGLKGLISASGLPIKPIEEMTDIEKDLWRQAANTATKNAMDEQAERLVRHTIQARRADIDMAASENISKLIERNVQSGGKVVDKLGNPVMDQFGNQQVKNLAQAYLDKGGFKIFGNSVISGARIRSAINLIKPAEDSINVFSPKAAKTLAGVTHARNIIASAFSTNWTEAGRIPDTAIQMMRSAKFKGDAQSAQLINGVPKLFKNLGITRDEDKLIAAAISGDRPPANGGDDRLATLWALIHNPDGNQVAKQIAAGEYGNDTVRMWKAATAVKDQLSKNLIAMHSSGMAAFPQKNYLPLLLNEPKNIVSPFKKFKTAEAINATKSELNKWVNVKDPTKVYYGTQEAARNADGEVVNFEKYNIAEERSRVQSEIQKTVLQSEQKKTAVGDQIEKLWGSLGEKQVKAIMSGSKDVIKGAAGGDLFNQQALEKVIREAVPSVDRKQILANYADKYYSNGSKLGAAPTELSAEDAMHLKEDLAQGDDELDSIAGHISSNLDKFGVKVGKSPEPGVAFKTAPGDYQKKLNELMGVIHESGVNGKAQYLKEALANPNESGKTLTDVISALSEEWHKDPGAISKTMEAILGKNHDLQTVLEDLSDTKRGLEQELKTPGLKNVADRWFYQDSEGETYARVRATAEEINQNLFDSKEMFTTGALRSMLGASMNTLRAVNTKNMLSDIAEKFGVTEADAPSDFVKVSMAEMSKQKGDLADVLSGDAARGPGVKDGNDLYYHPVIASAISQMMKVMDKDPVSNELLKGYDQLTNIFKSSVTTIFPAFYGRNSISNVWQSMMDIGHEALNPANHIMASQLQIYSHQLEGLFHDLAEKTSPDTLKQINELSSKVILTDKRGYQWTMGELDRVIRDNVVAFHPSILGMMDTGHSSSEMLSELEDHLFEQTNKWGTVKKSLNPMKQNFLPFQVGRGVANWTESQPRILNFLANLRNSGDVSFAAHQTKQFLYDHANLTPFERNFMRRIIPFYSYTRKNMEGMVQTLIHKPGRTDLFRNVYQNFGDVMGGSSLSDQERSMLPEWMRDSLDMVVKRNNGTVSLLTTMGSPFEAPFDELGNLFGGLNPIIKGPTEAATGYSFFEGKPLSQVTDATAFSSPLVPQAVKDFIGFTTKTYTDSSGQEHTLYVSLSPKNMNMFQNLPFTSRILSSLGMMQNNNITEQNKIFANIIGFKPTTVDMASEEFQRQKELHTKLEGILNSAGVGYTRTDYVAPTGTTMPALDKAPTPQQ